MNIPSILTLILSIICFMLAAIFLYTQKNFAANAKNAVGAVVGTDGKRPLVHFKAGLHNVTVPASVFDRTPIVAGKKVNLKYLPIGPLPQKWDIRIIGRNGYGQERIRKAAIFSMGGCACFLLLTGIFTAIL